jgi:hypothetical protein
MDKNISQIILDCCKKEGIEYTSCNPNFVAFCNDAKRLGEIILEINVLIDELDEILSRHNVTNGFKEQIKNDLRLLHNVDHDLVKLAKRIKEEKC